jgi:tetratricopeptide (TPR) repeat protein
MGLFKRRKPDSLTVQQLDGYASGAEVDVYDPYGRPSTEVVRPDAYTLGLMFEARRDEFGLHHPEALQAAHEYAVALGELPDYRANAIDLLEWLADVRLDDEESRLSILADLTRLLEADGRYERTEQRLADALAGWQRLRGPDDPVALTVATDLARVQIELGRLTEADTLIRDTIARRMRLLGRAHPDTITSRTVLAGTLRGTPARLAEAESMYRTIIADLAGGDLTQARSVRHSLAAVLYHQGKVAMAEKMFRDLLAERARDLGPEHPDVLSTRNDLAAVLSDRGQIVDAEVQLAEVYAVSRRALGPDHPDTLGSQVSLAAIRATQGRTAEAVPLLRAAIDGYRKTHGPDHPEIQALQAVLADLGGAR